MPIISTRLNRLGYSQKVAPGASRCGIIEARFITSFLEPTSAKICRGAHTGFVHHCCDYRSAYRGRFTGRGCAIRPLGEGRDRTFRRDMTLLRLARLKASTDLSAIHPGGW